jgi:hypothetical protein
MDKWVDFYEPYFAGRREAELFVEKIELLTPTDERHTTKIMMHQAQRLISITDDLPRLRPRRESLQLLFLIICAEHISKLDDGFKGEGQSKKYVKRFFDKFLLQPEKDKLGNGFVDNNSMTMDPLGIEKVIDTLYDVRCDVVHEGKYWGFTFHDGDTPMVNVDPDVIVYITFKELRDIVVKGCIRAIEDRLCPNNCVNMG